MEKIFKEGQKLTYKKRAIILSPNKPTNKIFFIKSGFLISYVPGKKGKRSILFTLSPGNIFPLTPGIIRTKNFVYVEALSDAELLLMDKDDFFKIVNSRKEYLRELTEMLSEYLYVYSVRLSNLELDTLEKRVIGRVIHYNSRFGVKSGEKYVIALPLTHTIIAESVNVARENVSRVLKRLENEKLIEFEKGFISVLNLPALEKKLQ